jgi:hypothetical protein
MELFVPGLIILIIAGCYVFLVLPRLGPMVLAVVSLIALVLAGINHYSMFYNEYKLSTWQFAIAAYTPWVILGLALITMISAIIFMFSGSDGAAKVMNAVSTPMEAIQAAVGNSVNSMPSANSATNPITAALNSVVANVAGPRNNTAKSATSATSPTSPTVPGLGYSASSV